MTVRRALIASGVLVAAGAMLLAWSSQRPQARWMGAVEQGETRSPAAGPLDAHRPAAEQRAAIAPSHRAPEAASPFAPASLQGTAVDGELAVDENGNLVVTAQLRRFFDYFLSARGEVSEAEIDRAVHRALGEKLPPAAAEEGGLLWERYQRYGEAGRALAASAEALGELPLRDRLERVAALRREIFGGAYAEALFGEEERVQRVDLARMEIQQDPTRTPAEKAEALAQLEQELPPHVREARQQSAVLEQLALLEASAGHDAQALLAERAALVGQAAAERLAHLDDARRAWNDRLAAFQQQLNASNGDLQQLLNESFNEREQIRVRVQLGLPH